MREPKNLDKYCSVEMAVKGLEDFARDLRGDTQPGKMVRWDLNIRFWHPSWKNDPRVGPRSTAMGLESVTDASGRLIAPPQPTTPERPSGPHDHNYDAREPVR